MILLCVWSEGGKSGVRERATGEKDKAPIEKKEGEGLELNYMGLIPRLNRICRQVHYKKEVGPQPNRCMH